MKVQSYTSTHPLGHTGPAMGTLHLYLYCPKYVYSRLREARVKIAMGGISNCLDYCEIFIAYTQFTNVVADRGLETHVLKCS